MGEFRVTGWSHVLHNTRTYIHIAHYYCCKRASKRLRLLLTEERKAESPKPHSGISSMRLWAWRNVITESI